MMEVEDVVWLVNLFAEDYFGSSRHDTRLVQWTRNYILNHKRQGGMRERERERVKRGWGLITSHT